MEFQQRKAASGQGSCLTDHNRRPTVRPEPLITVRSPMAKRPATTKLLFIANPCVSASRRKFIRLFTASGDVGYDFPPALRTGGRFANRPYRALGNWRSALTLSCR